MADLGIACVRFEDDEYMTVQEFAALPSDVHHAVWKAHAEKRVGSISAIPSAAPGSARRYNRAQVRDIARELEEGRG